jgi:hypothetical protein
VSDAPEPRLSTVLEHQLHDLGRAIDGVLLTSDQLRHWLKDGHPPFTATLAEGLAHYGEASAPFDLWCGCRAIARLREVWTGAREEQKEGAGI